MNSTLCAPSLDPVDRYNDFLKKVRTTIRQKIPFTYIAYQNLLPDENDDLLWLSYRVSYYVALRYFIQMGMQTISPLCGFIPYLPFLCDLVWIGSHWVCKNHNLRFLISRLTAGR